MLNVVASSVRGPAHIRDDLPCQDAWLALARSAASLAVVCDGMGSRPLAREGARAATIATRDAWRAWCRSSVGAADDLVRLLEVHWRLRLGSIDPGAAATTCLLYAEDGHGRALVAQLGDGVVARRSRDGRVHLHPSRNQAFGGLTHALGCPHSLADWSIVLNEPLRPGDAILLATDGVSDDLEPERIGDLISWAVEEIGGQAHAHRLLRAELRNWPVPRHQDDKTLLVMWNPWNP